MVLDDDAARPGILGDSLHRRSAERLLHCLDNYRRAVAIRKLKHQQLAILDRTAAAAGCAPKHGHRRAHNSAVGRENGIAVGSLERGVPQTHATHLAVELLSPDPVTYHDVGPELHNYRVDEISHHVLHA